MDYPFVLRRQETPGETNLIDQTIVNLQRKVPGSTLLCFTQKMSRDLSPTWVGVSEYPGTSAVKLLNDLIGCNNRSAATSLLMDSVDLSAVKNATERSAADILVPERMIINHRFHFWNLTVDLITKCNQSSKNLDLSCLIAWRPHTLSCDLRYNLLSSVCSFPHEDIMTNFTPGASMVFCTST